MESRAEQHEYFYRVLRPLNVWESPSKGVETIPGKAVKVTGEIVHIVERIVRNEGVYLRLAHLNGWIEELDDQDEPNVELMADAKVNHETGRFYYQIITPLTTLTAPDFLAPVVEGAKEFNAGDIVEGSERLTLPESKISFVKLAYSDGWLYETLLCGTAVLERLTKGPERETGEFYYLVRIPVGGRVAPNIMSNRSGKGYKLNTILVGRERFTPPGSKVTYVKLIDGESWVFETTMNGQTVLERLEHPIERDVKRTFYRAVDDVQILAKPALKSEKLKVRQKNTVLECSERLVPHGSMLAYLKLRHDDGWACETDVTGKVLLERIPGEAAMDETQKFYKVLISVAVRSAPDMHCARIPGLPAKPIGAIVGSSLRYTPPGGMTYVKLLHEHGWIFETTPDGLQVLETLSSDPDRQKGRFYYKALDRISMTAAPECTSAIVRVVAKDTIFEVDLRFTLPNNTPVTFLRYAGDNAWFREENDQGDKVVQPVSKAIYNLYSSPPSWLDIGFPVRKWYRVPSELGKTIVAEEALLQTGIFQVRNVLSSSSQGKDGVPLSRTGWIALASGGIPVTIEEIKHPASNLLFTFQWKQVWWIFHLDGVKHSVEIQHGLRGGYRAILLDGQVVEQERPVAGVLWDKGSSHVFEQWDHKFKVIIGLEGSFFSSYMQFFSYTLQIDGLSILQHDHN